MQGEGKDMNQLLNIAEAINFCAYDKSLHLQGDIRLGLVYKHFGRLDSFDVLCRLFVKQELGLSRDDFESKVDNLKSKLCRSKQKPVITTQKPVIPMVMLMVTLSQPKRLVLAKVA
jgi:hypothetical protein